MNTTGEISMLLSMFTSQLPVFAVCLVGVITVVSRWKQGGRGSIWALFGFGVSAILCVAIPVVQTAAQHWVIQDGAPVASRSYIFTAISILWSSMRAISYALLLIALFAGRPNPSAASPPA